MWIIGESGGRVYGNPLCYSCDFYITSMEKMKQKQERRKPVWILFFKEAIFPRGTSSNGCLLSKPRLFLSDFSTDANLSEQTQIFWDVFIRSSLSSHAMRVVLLDHHPFLSGSLTISSVHLHCAISESSRLIPTPGQSRRSGQESVKLKDWNIQGTARAGTERECGRTPLDWWGRDPRACLDPGQKSFAHSSGLEASTLCLADEGICLGMGNQERERREIPLGRGNSGLISSAWLGVNRMTALLKCTSGFVGSLPAPSRWFSALTKCSEVSGLPLWSWSDLVSQGTWFSVWLSKFLKFSSQFWKVLR